MRTTWFAAAFLSGVLLLVTAKALFAGVVVGETSTARASNGDGFSMNKTVYVQGNKQKVEGERVATITDLDESVVYVIDKKDRVYAEMPLSSLSPKEPRNMPPVDLNKTGKTRVIANYACTEYRTVQGTEREQVILSACVSTTAPGAREVAEFDRKMVNRLGRAQVEPSGDGARPGLTLEKQSVLSFRSPGEASNNASQTTSLMAQTRVNTIQLKPLPPEIFKPPRSYSKLMNRAQTPPSDLPESPDHTVDAVARGLLV